MISADRIRKSVPLGTTNYLYDGFNVVEEVDNSGNVLSRYTQGSHVDEWLAGLQSGTIAYYEQDGLDSVTSLSNSAGALANTYAYDSFGKTTTSTGTITNSFQYTGREFDAESGLYFYRARYYDSNDGRFIFEDPTGFEAGENFYRYVHNNSVNSTDPLGLDGGDAPGVNITGLACPGGYCGPSSTTNTTYSPKPGVPPASSALANLLNCLGRCIGKPVVATATTPLPGEQHQDPGHAAGTSVDIRPPAGVSATVVFCCAGYCGAAWGINEGPGGRPTLYTHGANYHLQLFLPHHPSPKAPNAIPYGCKPGGCSAPK